MLKMEGMAIESTSKMQPEFDGRESSICPQASSSAGLRVKLGNYQMPRSHNDISNCHSSFNYQAVAVFQAPAKLSVYLISALRHPGALSGGIISAQ